ncbi:hypothetical protein TNCV_5118311 [Trichonephila clavipes]|nr:hypothetical protein TNCV_5118311 [Trichonephila clavipes]
MGSLTRVDGEYFRELDTRKWTLLLSPSGHFKIGLCMEVKSSLCLGGKLKPKFEGQYEVLKVENNNVVIWKLDEQTTINVDQVRIDHPRERDEGVIESEGSDNNRPRVAQSEGLDNNWSRTT